MYHSMGIIPVHGMQLNYTTEGTMKIRLIWPHKSLNPNFRGHWAVKSRNAKRMRTEAYYATKAGKHTIPKSGKVFFKVTGYPPNFAKRDRDNFLASLKSAFDGIADAFSVNDVRFVPYVNQNWGPVYKGGKVEIEQTNSYE